MEGRLILLTGERGSGKTIVCQELVTWAQSEGLPCCGLLTLCNKERERVVIDIHSGDVRRLSVEPDTTDAIEQGEFYLDKRTLAWGNSVLVDAVPCDLLVVDELGPLEIERGLGWSKAFDVLRRADFALAVVVVRPSLLTKAQLKLPSGATTVLTIAPDNKQVQLEEIKRILRRQLESSID